MGLNDTPSSERIRISFFGKRNAGKSSLVNAITNQDLSVVSDTAGTTTDPVVKSMELLPLGPVLITDTPGYDDMGELGELRVRKTRQILNKTDIAILVTDGSSSTPDPSEEELLNLFRDKNIPCLIVRNKSDLLKDSVHTTGNPENTITGRVSPGFSAPEIYVSAKERTNIDELKNLIGNTFGKSMETRHLVADLLHPNDLIVLVIPIDGSAPKGRLILPQQQAIRDILEAGAYPICTRETELKDLLEKLPIAPDLVITDSQSFGLVSKIVPSSIPLTSFSILMAKYKGFLDAAVAGAKAIDELSDGDRVLICEGCTHHRQCGDIGTVKLPAWLKQRTGKELKITATSGADFPEDLSPYKLIIHCGGCMLSARELTYRMNCALDAKVPFTNYGVAIAYMKGILKRSITVFPEVLKLLDE